MVSFVISETTDYEALVPFFIENELEFSEDEPVPTDIVKCWKITEREGDEDSERLIGGFVLAKREGEFIVDGIAIAPEHRKFNFGRLLLEQGIREARDRGGRRIFLVARAPEFFRKHGFVTVPKEEAPNFFECLTCPQFEVSCHPEVMRRDL